MRPRPSAQIASICGSCFGSIEPESFAMFLVCQSIRPSSLRGWENQAIFANRSPTAIRNIRPFRLRRKQMPETSRSGTSTTRCTRSRFLFDLPFPMGGDLCGPQGHCGTIKFGGCGERYWLRSVAPAISSANNSGGDNNSCAGKFVERRVDSGHSRLLPDQQTPRRLMLPNA